MSSTLPFAPRRGSSDWPGCAARGRSGVGCDRERACLGAGIGASGRPSAPLAGLGTDQLPLPVVGPRLGASQGACSLAHRQLASLAEPQAPSPANGPKQAAAPPQPTARRLHRPPLLLTGRYRLSRLIASCAGSTPWHLDSALRRHTMWTTLAPPRCATRLAVSPCGARNARELTFATSFQALAPGCGPSPHCASELRRNALFRVAGLSSKAQSSPLPAKGRSHALAGCIL